MTNAVWDNLDRVCDLTRLVPNFDISEKHSPFWHRFNPNNYENLFFGKDS